jgi:ketoreductase RED2
MAQDHTSTSNGEFAGRVAIVTGSSSGIGEATAQRLSALGCAVVVNSASSVEAGQAVAAALPSESLYPKRLSIK